MRLPIHVHYSESIEEVEDRWRKMIRKDRQVSKSLNSLSVMLYEQTSGAVGVMYEAQYRAHETEYAAALTAIGFKLVRTVQMPTCHATILRRVI